MSGQSVDRENLATFAGTTILPDVFFENLKVEGFKQAKKMSGQSWRDHASSRFATVFPMYFRFPTNVTV